MSSVVTIPLPQNPDVAELVTDMQPGQKLYGCFSLKSKNDQTIELRIEEMAATRDELPDGKEHSDGDSEDQINADVEGDEDEQGIAEDVDGGY